MKTSLAMNISNRRIGPGCNQDDPEKGELQAPSRENRWCARHGYFIDLTACEARAKTRRSCGRCIARWQQLSFSFMES
jgi:hypothetical protein